MSKSKLKPRGRIVAIDLHPDVFSSCLFKGQANHDATIVKRFRDLPTASLKQWAKKHLQSEDLVLIEASANSFEAVRLLESLGFSACVLESAHVSKVADSFVDDDVIASERIGRCYLTGMAKVVWVPDVKTSERRELLHVYLKATQEETRAVNGLRGYLTQFQIRLEKRNPRSEETQKWILEQREWSEIQQLLLRHHFERLTFTVGESEKLFALICREVLRDKAMSECLRVLGIGPINAFAIVATVGDIKRFSSPEKLANYLALHPGRKQSGKGKNYQPGTGKRGRKEMRCLLVQAAQVVMRQKAGANDLRDWGWRLYLRKGNRNVAVVAVARKLAIQLWHLMQGGCVTLEDQKRSLHLKVTRLLRRLSAETRIQLGYCEKVSDSVEAFFEKIDVQPAKTI